MIINSHSPGVEVTMSGQPLCFVEVQLMFRTFGSCLFCTVSSILFSLCRTRFDNGAAIIDVVVIGTLIIDTSCSSLVISFDNLSTGCSVDVRFDTLSKTFVFLLLLNLSSSLSLYVNIHLLVILADGTVVIVIVVVSHTILVVTIQ